jgi:hypothetical protein
VDSYKVSRCKRLREGLSLHSLAPFEKAGDFRNATGPDKTQLKKADWLFVIIDIWQGPALRNCEAPDSLSGRRVVKSSYDVLWMVK